VTTLLQRAKSKLAFRYFLPPQIQKHVDYVTPGIKFSAPVKKGTGRQATRKSKRREPITSTGSQSVDDDALSLDHCDTAITPACIKALYKIPDATSSSPNNSMGLYESGDTYAQEDLDLYYAKYTPNIPKGTHPIPAFIDGATAPVPVDQAGGESDVDMTIALSLIYPQTVTLYQSDNSNFPGPFNTFLDALDGVSNTRKICSLPAINVI
jgi:tripeptidyl-peptidase-1